MAMVSLKRARTLLRLPDRLFVLYRLHCVNTELKVHEHYISSATHCHWLHHRNCLEARLRALR